MLGKLLKYEFKATQRTFLPLYALVILFALINKAFIVFNIDKAEGFGKTPFIISMALYVAVIVAVFVMTLIVTIQRFQKNLLGDEGYLSFTLPVKVHSHIDSKMIVSFVWCLLSVVVALLSILIFSLDGTTKQHISEFFSSVSTALARYPASGWLIVEMIVLCLICSFMGILQIYAAMVIGNFSSKHKLFMGFLVYLGFSVLEQIVVTCIASAGMASRWWTFFEDVQLTPEAAVSGTAGLMGIAIAYCAVFGTAFYFLTNWILSRKLNLE